MRFGRKSVTWVWVLLLTGMCMLCYICTIAGASDAAPHIISVVAVGCGSLLILAVVKENCFTNGEFLIVAWGYAARVICMAIDLYGRTYVTVLHSGADSEGFYAMANRYYNGDYSGFYTRYPYIIRGIYEVFGKNRMVAQYVNIVFWALTVIVALRICNRFGVGRKNRLMACSLLAFLPNSIFLSSILMRESMMMFLDVWGLYYFICWMEEGKRFQFIMAFLVPVPAIMLHTASIGVWIAFILILSVWDRKKHRYRVSAKTGIVLMLLIIGMGVIYFTRLRELFMDYLPTEFSLYSFTHKKLFIGESDYLDSMDCQSRTEFCVFTLVRMFYFVCSPVITEIRGIKDYAAILGDVLPTILVMGSICVNVGKRKKAENGKYAFAGLIMYFVIVGIFAWGTRNAGTALRHRGMIWGILVAAWCIGRGERKTQREECQRHPCTEKD